ncbi:MAG: outer membrane beta-barrel protein [bacterium]|jgi:hypothetical protein
MIRRISQIACALILSISVKSQTDTTSSAAEEKKSNFTFSGSIDGYFRSDLNESLSNNRTSFTNTTGKLALGMVSAKVDYNIKKFSFTADLGIGKRAEEFAYNDKGAFKYVKQLYGAYAAADWLKITAGTWATHVGYELLDPHGNRNYSMSYMFSYGPFLHTGVKSDFTFGGTGFMIGVANPTDYRNSPNPNKKALLFQFSQAISENVKVYLNYVGGQRPTDKAKTRQFDLVLTGKVNDQFNVGLNATTTSVKTPNASNTYGDAKSWWGTAAYLNFDPVKNLGFTLRSELFDDEFQLAAMGAAPYGATIFANTISANVKVGPIMIVPEVRIESATNNVYSTKIGAERSSATSILLGAYYKF